MLVLVAASGCGGNEEEAAPPATPAPPVASVEIDLDAPETVGLLKRSVPAGRSVRLSLSTATDPGQYSILLWRNGRAQAAQGNDLTIQTRDTVQPGEVLEYHVSRKDSRRTTVVRIQVAAEPTPPRRWEDEGTWLAGEVADRLVRLLYRAGKLAPAPDDLSVEVRRRGARTRNGYEVVVANGASTFQAEVGRDGVWLPESYDGVARLALEAWGPVARQPTRPVPDLPRLLARSPESGLHRANRDVSGRLDELPGSAVVHDEAALVLGCLGLREAAGAITDHRRILSRMTAHLAAARALRGADADPTPAGRLARLALDALTGRQSVVVEGLDSSARALAGQGPRAWARALRIRATGDWRLLKAPARATPLEQLEQYRALVVGRGAAHGLDMLRQIDPPDLPDWGRIALSEHATVQAGNVFANALLEAELKLAADDLLPEGTSRETPEALVAALRSAHEGDAGGNGALDAGAISPRMWAAYHERHLVAAVSALLRHLNHALGMRLEAEEAYRTFSSELAGLPLFPRVGLQFKPSRGEHPWRTWNAAESCEALAALSRESPERLVPVGWKHAAEACPEQRSDGRLASFEGWFGELHLPGTAFWPAGRFLIEPFGSLSLEDVEVLHRLAPWNFRIAQVHHVRIGASRPEALEESYGPLLEINATALRAATNAYKKDPEAYLERYRSLCEVEPDECYEYARMLRTRGRPEEVMRAYERAVRHGRDRLSMSKDIGWLVSYYAETGRTDRAMELALQAAAVGSHEGLATLGALLEQTGRVDEASEVFHRLAERYEAGGHVLDRFLAAYLERVGDERFGAEAEASFSRVFPGGLERVDLDDFDEPPLSGVVFIEESAYLRDAGLGEGGVVVALDGYRVHNVRQYLCVRRFRFERDFEIIVYYQTRYRKVRASLPLRSFDATFADYPRN